MDPTGQDSLWRQIAFTAQAMRSYADGRLKGYDLTVEQFQVLKQLAVDQGQPQRRLSRLTGKSPANMTRILDRLARKNRIVRQPHPEDRRSTLVFLTEAGRDLRDEVTKLCEDIQAEMVESIDTGRQQIAVEVIQAIRNKIEKLAAS